MQPNQTETKTKSTETSIIQYNTLHYNIQYNITNTIIQIEKKQMKPKETTDPIQMKRNQLYDTI